jgi:hypothetical protein|tara:strand:- start:6112 stop:6945 length:834 start_codon:yes stop_codon:yes gene_type:complete
MKREKKWYDDDIIRVKLKDLVATTYHGYAKLYDWDTLREKMVNDGYNPEIDTLLVKKSVNFKKGQDRRYYVIDGNHRLKLLKELYDDNYEIDVTCEKNFIKKVISSFKKEPKKKPDTIEKPSPPIFGCTFCKLIHIKEYLQNFFNPIQLVNTIKVVTAMVFMFGFNFKYLVWMTISIIMFGVVSTLLKELNFEPTKIKLPIGNTWYIKQIIMTLISNIPQLTLMIPLAIITVLIIINGPIEFLITGTIIYFGERYTSAAMNSEVAEKKYLKHKKEDD